MDLAAVNSPAAAFVAGLVTSLHCAGMCGPLACALMPVRGDAADAQTVSTTYHVTRLASYAALARFGALELPSLPAQKPRLQAELVFVETASGLAQAIALTPADEALFRAQLARVVEFLTLRLRARERLRGLRFRPAFAAPRPGQETTQAELTQLFERRPLVLFEAPTGYGKTGCLLEFALGQMRSGRFARLIWLTGKSTGQLQVVHTLEQMTASNRGGSPGAPELTSP